MQRDQPCYAFIYTPNNSAVVDELIKSVRLSNSPPVPQDQVMAMSSPDEVRNSVHCSTVTAGRLCYAIALLKESKDLQLRVAALGKGDGMQHGVSWNVMLQAWLLISW